MDTTQQVYLILALALAFANWPFLSQRLFLFAAVADKSMVWRLIEMLIGYFVVGGVGLYLENASGQVARQTWEFYATTGFLYLTLAFPGFVYRYLWRH